jgi:hypothetical protein
MLCKNIEPSETRLIYSGKFFYFFCLVALFVCKILNFSNLSILIYMPVCIP